MTYEEAIKTIKTAIAEIEWEYPMNYLAAFDMAIKAMTKQVPKKPRLASLAEDRICNYSTLFRCPTCNHGLKEKEDYCQGCGQYIDW